MARKATCFTLLRGAVVIALFVGIAQAIPLEQLDREIMQNLEDNKIVQETTTSSPGWGWGGWDDDSSSGATGAFGQTMVITDLAGSNVNQLPSVVEATAEDTDSEFIMEVINHQEANLEMDINSWADGGGDTTIPDAYSSVDGPYVQANQGALYDSNVTFGNAMVGGISSNPQTSASLSAGLIVLSSSGQVSNGTNVNPGANANNGWGWKDDNSGWNSPSTSTENPGWGSGWDSSDAEGATASASSIEVIENLSQQASSSDNITGLAVSTDYDYVSLDATISAPIAIDSAFNGNSVYVSTNSTEAETEWQNFAISSYPETDASFSVDTANAVALSAQPNSTTTLSFGSIIVSDFATTSNGTNLVNQNNGGWGNNGWGQANQGWGLPAP